MDAPAEGLETVRGEVQRLLDRSSAYQSLPADERQRLVEHMAKVGAFLAGAHPATAAAHPAARALETTARPETAAPEAPPPSPEDQLRRRLAAAPEAVGKGFVAGAVREGVAQFGEMVQKVDFPKFVSGLIKGVFQAVVDASIQQMQAFGELLAATSKTVDQFARDNISDGQARDFVANRYPNAVRVDTSDPNAPARLKPVDGSEVDLGHEFNVSGVDLESEEDEQRLVDAAKLQMAQQRQQTLSTMVLLGINRIVVTNGHINAKVVFDMRADDVAKNHSRAEMHDSRHDSSASFYSFGVPFAAGGGYSSQDHVATVSSAVDDTSEAKAAVKAQLTGDVRLAFKSETFPLERMVDVLGMQQLQQKAAPTPTKPAPAPAAAATPAPAPVPAPAAAAPIPAATGGAR